MRVASSAFVVLVACAGCDGCGAPKPDGPTPPKSATTLAQDRANKEIDGDNVAAKVAELEVKVDAELAAERAALPPADAGGAVVDGGAR